ncbi:kinase-like domain, phloem protein 2-like protein [Tanacetum coccineum]
MVSCSESVMVRFWMGFVSLEVDMGTYLRVEEYEGFGWCVLISGGLLFVAMLLRDGKALWLLAVVKALWFSINDKEQHCLMLSIEDCLIRDDPKRDYSDEYSSQINSRFVAGCYKAHMMKFKIRVVTPLFLSPDVTYGVNLVFKYSEIEQMKPESFHVMYKLLGETEIWMVNIGDLREDGWLVAELYHFTNEGEKSILDLEIIFEDCGLSGYFYIEGIEFQPVRRVEQPVLVVEYKEILKHGVTPLFYRCTEKLKLLLTRGILLNGGKTLFCLNDKGEHIERIFIEACLNPNAARGVKHRDDCVNSRFPGGACYEYGWCFTARVRSQYLTPRISYTVNIILRYKHEYNTKFYGPMRYKINGEDETKVFIIYPTDMRQDGWFVVPLYHFTSNHTTADLQFEFEYRITNMSLLVAGFEFQPSQEKVELQVFEEYQHIVEVASQSLFYTSLDELKQILSKGVHLNGYKTWFLLNGKGEHCHMISIQDCLIPNEDFPSQYKSDVWSSRFRAGLYQTNNKGFKTHVKTYLLSPLITYTVNLVFDSSSYDEQAYVDLKYRLRGETTSFTVYLGKHTDGCLYMAELYQFTSDGSIFDLEIMSFKKMLSGENVSGGLGLQQVEDPYLSNNTENKAIKKNLFSTIGQWFQFNNDTAEDDTLLEYSYLEEKEKKCVMLSARVVCFTTEEKDRQLSQAQEEITTHKTSLQKVNQVVKQAASFHLLPLEEFIQNGDNKDCEEGVSPHEFVTSPVMSLIPLKTIWQE